MTANPYEEPMPTTCCPDCLQPVDVAPSAREGRCPWCRPTRQHSRPRKTYWRHVADDQFRRFVAEHNPSQ